MSSMILMLMSLFPGGKLFPTELSASRLRIFTVSIWVLFDNTEQVETKFCELILSRLHLYPRTLVRPSQCQHITPTSTDIFDLQHFGLSEGKKQRILCIDNYTPPLPWNHNYCWYQTPSALTPGQDRQETKELDSFSTLSLHAYFIPDFTQTVRDSKI